MVSAENKFALFANAARRAVYRVLTHYSCGKARSQFKHAASSRTVNQNASGKFIEHLGQDFRRPLKPNRFYDAFFWRHPRMREALDTWNRRYDAELDRLDRLEAEGRAYVFYANDQGVKNTERDAEKLARNYERGRMQALSEFDRWERFLSGQGA